MSHIQCQKVIARRKTRLVDHCYHYKPTGRFQWLQRLAFKFLYNHTGALTNYSETVTTYNIKNLQSKEIQKQIFELIRNHAQYDLKYDRVIMGAEEFDKLTGNSTSRDFLHFDYIAGVPVGNRSGVKIYDVPIYVYPWIKGMALI